MICEACGQKTGCVESRTSFQFPGGVDRRYICKYCGHRMYTHEVSKAVLESEHKELQELKKRILNIQCLLYEVRKATEGKK